MSKLWSKRYMVAIILAVGAFVGTFYAVFAGTVQWSREQPATVNVSSADKLADSSFKLCRDVNCTQELSTSDKIVISAQTLAPPLDKLFSGSSYTYIWAKNMSTLKLRLLGGYGLWWYDPTTGQNLFTYQVSPDNYNCDGFTCGKDTLPGDTNRISIRLGDFQTAARSKGSIDFKIIIGAIGTSGDAPSSPSSSTMSFQAIQLDGKAEQPSIR